MDLNICTFTGRLGKKPELSKTNSGKSVTSCSIAVSGMKKDSTTWVQLECWDKVAEHICQYCEPGTYVAVNGQLKNKEYTDKNGNKRVQTVISVANFQMIGNKNRENSEAQAYAKTNPEFAAIEDDDGGDLPF